MLIREARPKDIDFVVSDMLPADREEQFACMFEPAAERHRALRDRLQASLRVAIRFCAMLDDEGYPGALVAAFLASPGVAAVYHLRSSAWPGIARAAHRFYVRTFIPTVLVPNVRLAECRIMASHAEARAWVLRLGFRENGEPLPYGSQGQLFVHAVWVNANWREETVAPRAEEPA